MTTPTYWIMHCHHDRLVEPAIKPIAVRIAYIKANKPESEIATRLRLIREVPASRIPLALRQAQAAYDQARAAYEPALIALHAELCVPDCPWDGRTIFA